MSEPVGWPQNTYVRQKVVCIRGPKIMPRLGPDHDYAGRCKGPQVGQVYVIRSIICWEGLVGFRLEGLVVRNWTPGEEGAWLYERFRPVQSTETGFKLLTALLVPTKQKENA